MPIGIKATLRGKRMYDFMERFFNVVCPRISDFRGFRVKGDGSGNYTLGLDDQQIFPELNLDEVKRSQGMHITFVKKITKNVLYTSPTWIPIKPRFGISAFMDVYVGK